MSHIPDCVQILLAIVGLLLIVAGLAIEVRAWRQWRRTA